MRNKPETVLCSGSIQIITGLSHAYPNFLSWENRNGTLMALSQWYARKGLWKTLVKIPPPNRMKDWMIFLPLIKFTPYRWIVPARDYNPGLITTLLKHTVLFLEWTRQHQISGIFTDRFSKEVILPLARRSSTPLPSPSLRRWIEQYALLSTASVYFSIKCIYCKMRNHE